MTKQTRITANLTDLENFTKKLGTEYVCKVGFVGDMGSELHQGTDMSNAEIALIQEFGSETNGIPPRSMLRLPLELKQKDLVKAMGKNAPRAALETGDIEKVYKIMGVEAENIILDAFETGGFGQWAPNADSTIKRKGSDKPLIDTTQLRRAVTSEVVKRGDLL